jgi:hypothetical protein
LLKRGVRITYAIITHTISIKNINTLELLLIYSRDLNSRYITRLGCTNNSSKYLLQLVGRDLSITTNLRTKIVKLLLNYSANLNAKTKESTVIH